MSQYGVNVETGEGTRRPLILCGPGKTKQSEAEACDINLIMAAYRRTGFVTHVRKGLPEFGDVSMVSDYQTVVEHLRNAEMYFMTLPAKVRETFDHATARFLDFLADPETTPELLEERGLIVLEKPRQPASEPSPVEEEEEGGGDGG